MVPAPVIRSAACEPEQVRGIFAKVPLAKVQVLAGDHLGEILERGQCFGVYQGGQMVGAYVLQASGGEVWVSAAAGSADFDMTAVLAQLIEGRAGQFESIAFQTRRRGLVKKAERHGYQLAGRVGECGYLMRKKLK